MIRYALCLALALPLTLHAEGAPTAYSAIMRAQYAARTAVPPLPAAEAERVYDAYLRSIGAPAKTPHSGDKAGMSSRPDPAGAKADP